jgi:hypothetical protein
VAASGETAAGAELTVFPTGTSKPPSVALHPRVGASTSNQVTVAVGTGGAVRFATNTGATHVRADVVGYFAVDDVGAYEPWQTGTILDTRGSMVPGNWPAGLPLIGGGWFSQLDLPVTGEGTGVPENASAVVLSVMSLEATTANSTINVFPAGTPNPGVPNVYPQRTAWVTNHVTTSVGFGGKVSIAIAGGAAHVLVSIAGYFTPYEDDLFFPLTQARVIDTRATGAALVIPGHTGPLPPGSLKSVDLAGRGKIPATSRALALTMVSTQASSGVGLFMTWPTSGGPILSSSLGFGNGYNTTNTILGGVGPNAGLGLANFSPSSTHLVAYVYGYFL